MTATGLEEIPPGSRINLRVGSVMGVAVILVLVLSYLLTGGGSEIFERKVALKTYMADATGLTDKLPVRLNGVRIGSIRRVAVSEERDPQRVALIEMSIHEKFLPQISDDSIAAVTADNLLGDEYIDIQVGRSNTSVKPGDEVRSLTATQFNGADLIQNMEAVLKQVDALLTQIEHGDTRLGRFFHDETFYNALRVQITGIQEAIGKASSPKTVFGRMFFTDELYRQIEQPVLNLDKLLAEMQAGKGSAGVLFADSKQYDQLQNSVASLRKSLADVNAGKGPNAALLHDQAMYDHAVAFVNSFGKSLDDLQQGKGTLGNAFVSPGLYDSLNGTSRSMRDLIADVRKNPQKYLRVKVF